MRRAGGWGEGRRKGGVREDRRGEEVTLWSVVRVLAQRIFMGWWYEEAFETAGRSEEVVEWRSSGSFTQGAYGMRWHSSANAGHPASSTLVKILCARRHARSLHHISPLVDNERFFELLVTSASAVIDSISYPDHHNAIIL